MRQPWLLALLLSVGCGAENPLRDLRVDRDVGEAEEGSDARRVQLCTSGPFLYSVWADDRSGMPQIYANRSYDGGRSWAPDDTHVSQGSLFVADNPSMDCDQGRVVVAWEDDRHSDLGDPTIYTRSSEDGGATWGAEQLAGRDGLGSWRAQEPQVKIRGRWAYLIWTDNRGGAFDVFFTVSQDLGASWAPETRLDTDGAGEAYSANAVLAIDDQGGVYVAWEDSRSLLNDIYYNRSSYHGFPDTWLYRDVRLDSGDDPGSANSYAPSISARDGMVAVAWHDRRNGSEPDVGADIYVQVAADGTNFFGTAKSVDDREPGFDDSMFPSVAVLDDMSIGMVWRDASRGPFDIFWARSTDGGATFPEPVQVDVRSDANSGTPMLSTAPGGRIGVAWADFRNSPDGDPREDIYANSSGDYGATWGDDWRVNDYPAGLVRAVSPSIAVDAELDEVRVAWEDWRSGSADIYYRVTTTSGAAPDGETP